MKPLVFLGPSFEAELKLALRTSNAATLENRLARLPVLVRSKPSQQHLHNVYYDTVREIVRFAQAED
jgi:inorganic triphosphatase YgiF